MLKIGISINDIFRDFSKNFEKIYNGVILDELVNEINLDKNEKFIEVETKNGEIIKQPVIYGDLTDSEVKEEITDSEIKFSDSPPHFEEQSVELNELKFLKLDPRIDELLLTHRFKFKNEEQYFYYLFSQYSFELFAKTTATYKNAIQELNEYIFSSKDKNSVTLFTQEVHNSRPSTLYFLARERFVGPNLKFYEGFEKVWKDYNVVITTSPFLLNTKPENKISIKINTEYNKDCESNFAFDSFSDFLAYYKEQNKK